MGLISRCTYIHVCVAIAAICDLFGQQECGFVRAVGTAALCIYSSRFGNSMSLGILCEREMFYHTAEKVSLMQFRSE